MTNPATLGIDQAAVSQWGDDSSGGYSAEGSSEGR